tara:strand:+ start:1360 stop:3408 length:2049 start_codon:yes stop_codon:yes gene_type:complete
MQFLERRMFSEGGGVDPINPYFYVTSDNKQVPLNVDKLYEVLTTAGISELSALIQNPDVTYSPETQELFRRVVGERAAQASGATPNNIVFGELLPDFLDLRSGLTDIGGFVKDTGLEAIEKVVGFGRGFMADQGEPQDLFVSERYPFKRKKEITPPQLAEIPQITEDMSFPEKLGTAIRGGAISVANIASALGSGAAQSSFVPDRSGLLRMGFSNEELDAILKRAQEGEIRDFQEEVSKLTDKDEDVVETAVVSEVPEEPELPRGIVEIRNIDPDSYEDDTIRRLQYERDMITRDDLGRPLPDTQLLQSREIQEALDQIRPAEVKVDVDKTEIESLADVEEKFAGLSEDEISEELEKEQKKFLDENLDLNVQKPTLDVASFDEEEDDTLRDTFGDPISKKIDQPGFFGSNRFLDFIRETGKELIEKGQIGPGLAAGAAKAAEVRAARELAEETREKTFLDKVAIEKIKANLKDLEGVSASDAEKIAKREELVAEDLANFDKNRRTLSNLNKAISIIDAGGAGGLQGLFGEVSDMIIAAAKQGNPGKKFDDLEPRTKANAILNVLRQANVREILGESGKTISNLDRQIVEEVFGDIKVTTPISVTIKKLEDSRNSIINNLEKAQNRVMLHADFFKRLKVQSAVMDTNSSILDLLRNFSTANATSYIASDADSVGEIIDTTLAD